MAGTYTSNLNLYKPAAGELSWATLVNANWDLIDAAMATAGAVSSVFGRTGVVVAQAGDYAWADITKTAGTDFYAPGSTDVAIADGGTGASTAQLAIDALTQVSGATDEYVLTKDTASGHAIFKPAVGSGITDIVSDTTPQLGGQLDNNGNAIGDGTNEILKFGETASAVNEVTITNAATTGSPSIAATGDDTNIDLTLQGKGSGSVKIGGSTAQIADANGNELIKFTATASAVNEFTVTNKATGASPILSATGGDTDIDIVLTPKGAGLVKMDTVPVVGTTSTQTLTNKRVTKRVVTTTDDATAVIDCDVTDVYQLSAVANATAFSVTGTPTDGQMILLRFKDAGVAKALSWTGITGIGVTLPTITVANKWHRVLIEYNLAATAWHGIAVGVQA